jgi:hypothetical protein
MKNITDRYDNVDLTENAANIVREENKKKKIRFVKLDDNDIPIVRNDKKQETFCEDCGRKLTDGSTLCASCFCDIVSD